MAVLKVSCQGYSEKGEEESHRLERGGQSSKIKGKQKRKDCWGQLFRFYSSYYTMEINLISHINIRHYCLRWQREVS